MTDAELIEDERVIAAATPTPWLRRHYPDCLPLIKMPNDEIQDIPRVEDADFICRARDRMPALVAEVRRLREIVAKLPVTADGVAVGPNTTLYYIHPNPTAKKKICEVNSSESPWTNYTGPGPDEFVRMSIADAYSTREAALAAKEQTHAR